MYHLMDGRLGEVPVRISVLDSGDVEAELSVPGGTYVASAAPAGGFFLRTVSGEGIEPDDEGVFRAPGLYLRAMGCQMCGGSEMGLVDGDGNVLFRVKSFLGAMCTGATISVLGDVEAVRTDVRYSIKGDDAISDTRITLPDGRVLEKREVRDAFRG